MFKTSRFFALLFLLCPAFLWAIPPSVVFNGVVNVLDTGTTSLNHPAGVAVGASGNLYIVDTAHNQIVRVTAEGAASVVPVSGLSTGLSAPRGIALDGSGNFYVADTGNNRLVLMTSAFSGSVVDIGAVTLVSPAGVAMDASGNLYISDTGNNRIVKIPSGGAASVLNITGLGTALSAPAGLAVDAAGTLFIADEENNRIVKVTTGGAGSAVSISGLGTALSAPTGIAVDSWGNLYIADSGNNRVVNVTSGGAGSVASTGGLTLNAPSALAVDPFGAVYVADTANSRVLSLMMSAVGYGELQVGASSSKSLTLPFTVGVATTLGSVQALTLGTQSLDFTLGTGTTCTDGTTNTTCEVEVDFLPLSSGLRRGAVALFDQSATLLAIVPIYGIGGAPMAALSPGTASAVGTGGVSLSSPFQAAIDGNGNIYVANYIGSNVVKIAAGGGSASVVSTGAYTLNEAAGVAVDGAGSLYISDYGHNRIVQVKSTGTASLLSVTGLSTGINQPAALALDSAGNLYIADWGNSRIVKVSPAGVGYVLSTRDYALSTAGVTGVAVDSSGNVYIADRIANRIVKVTPSGAASLVSITGLTLSNPQGVAVDGGGNLYIADSGHRRIVEITVAGEASVVQTPGLTLGNILYGVTADANGNVYAADWSNNRITKVSVAAAALTFANTEVGATSTDSPKTATVTNLGNQGLTFSANPSYTADFPENTSDSNPCTSNTSLEPGESCDVSVMFTPQSVGSLSTNVTVTNNHLNGSNVTQNVAVSGTAVNPITPTITWTQPAAISYGTTLSAALNAAAMDGSTSVDGTYAYTATLQGGTASSVTATTVLGAGSYTLSVSFTPSSGNYTSATGGVSLTVNKASPSVSVASSASPVLVSSSITFTATVSSTVSTPTGSVDFYDGTTLLGSGTLAAGSATYATSSLTAGTHTITAEYAGDSNFQSVTSSDLSQVVRDFTWSTATGGSTSAVVSPGGTANYALVLSPGNGVTFPAAVTLAVTGLPAGAVGTFTPESLASGAGTTNVALAVQVPAQTASARALRGGYLALVLPMIAGMMLLPFARGSMRKTATKYGQALLLVLLVLAIPTIIVLAGCGDTSHPVSRTPQNYSLTVTATCNSLAHSTTLSLTVQ